METYQKILFNGIKKDRNQQFILAFMFLLLAYLLYFRWAVELPTEMPSTTIFLRVIAGVLLLLAGGLIFTAFKTIRIQKTKLFRSLNENPEKIVWVYAYKLVPMPFGIKFSDTMTVFFYFIDGSSFDLRIPAENYDLLIKELNRKLPHATFGHSKQKEQLFRANPALLLRSDEKEWVKTEH